MSQLVIDAEMARKISEATAPLQLVTAEGTAVGVCTPIRFPRSPYSREEIEDRRRECREHPERGSSLREALAQLEASAGAS
jgi:hypothetical protein